jgi:hypothetical protein
MTIKSKTVLPCCRYDIVRLYAGITLPVKAAYTLHRVPPHALLTSLCATLSLPTKAAYTLHRFPPHALLTFPARDSPISPCQGGVHPLSCASSRSSDTATRDTSSLPLKAAQAFHDASPRTSDIASSRILLSSYQSGVDLPSFSSSRSSDIAIWLHFVCPCQGRASLPLNPPCALLTSSTSPPSLLRCSIKVA